MCSSSSKVRPEWIPNRKHNDNFVAIKTLWTTIKFHAMKRMANCNHHLIIYKKLRSLAFDLGHISFFKFQFVFLCSIPRCWDHYKHLRFAHRSLFFQIEKQKSMAVCSLPFFCAVNVYIFNRGSYSSQGTHSDKFLLSILWAGQSW